MFLLSGGLDSQSSQRCFASALRRARQSVGNRRIEHIGPHIQYADIITLWMHDKRFVDRTGKPRALRLSGQDEFECLVRSVDPSLNSRRVLSVLTRYGNVRRASHGRFLLTRPFFFTSSRESMAFEPIACFLSDASATLGKILMRARDSRKPELFWRKVETSGLSNATAQKFVEYVAGRSLNFLEEIDDWLEARRKLPRVSNAKKSRIGLGLFSIYSEADDFRMR